MSKIKNTAASSDYAAPIGATSSAEQFLIKHMMRCKRNGSVAETQQLGRDLAGFLGYALPSPFDETFTNYSTYILMLYIALFLFGGVLRVFIN